MKKLTQDQIKLIKQKIAIDQNKFIIRLNVAGNNTISVTECNNNVYCIDDEYEIFWQIEAKPTGFERDPFVYIKFDNGELIAKNFSGFKYLVNLENGQIIRGMGWDK